jgi:hypothetical protein
VKWIVWSLLLAVAAAAGWLVWAAHRGMFGLCLNLEIKPIEIFTLAVTVIIAILLQYYFVSSHNADRAEKELLMDNIRDVLATLRACRAELDSCRGGAGISAKRAAMIIALIRRLSNELENLQTALGMSRCRKFGDDMERLREMYLAFKIAATGGYFPTKPYNQSSISSQEQAFRSLNVGLQKLLFRVNQN